MKKILITSFVPFGGITTNSSQEVLKRLADNFGGACIIKAELDVAYETITGQIDELLEHHHPDVVLLLGQAGKTAEVHLELVGVNLILSKAPDNHGIIRYDECIHPDGENAYFSTAGFASVIEDLQPQNLPVSPSLSAGGYLCNMALYHTLYRAAKAKLQMKVGFIHFPYYDGQMAKEEVKSLPLEEMVRTLETVLISIIK